MTSAHELLSAQRASVAAAAGCGKTHLIGEAVALSVGRELVLTHTNAGAQAIRHRVQRLGGISKCVVLTFDSWCQQFVKAYPKLADAAAVLAMPERDRWVGLRRAMLRLLNTPSIQAVVRVSYTGVFLDEHQDCDDAQHRLALALADLLPVRILGDPLQAIFGWDSKALAWSRVEDDFAPLEGLQHPHRWANTNPVLGQWVQAARARLEGQNPAIIQPPAVTVSHIAPEQLVSFCFEFGKSVGNESVVVIFRSRGAVERFSRSTGGFFQVVEPIDPAWLVGICRVLDNGPRECRFAALKGAFAELTKGEKDDERGLDAVIEDSLSAYIGPLGRVDTPAELANSIAEAMRSIDASKKPRPFRRELWSDLLAAVDEVASGRRGSLTEALQMRRALRSRRGRVLKWKHVGTHHVVKGLEFDHCIAVEPGESPQLTYVAISRGSKSLTVFGESDWLKFGIR